MQDEFERSVFVNCPFDPAFAPILQALLFCILYFDLVPRLATERVDSAEMRLEKIRGLIGACRYSIHDLSRCEAAAVGERYRLNMPFELGIDYGCRHFAGGRWSEKKILVLEERAYRYQAALSDIAGCDIAAHGGDFQIAVRKVRNWLVTEAAVKCRDAAQRVTNAYLDFRSWHFERQTEAGFSAEDVRDQPTAELLTAMRTWFAQGRPT